MKRNNKKFNNAMHKFVGVLDKYDLCAPSLVLGHNLFMYSWMYIEKQCENKVCLLGYVELQIKPPSRAYHPTT